MNKAFYTSTILILGISVATGLLQNALYLLLGGQLFMLQSFWGWFLVLHLVGLAASYFSLRYFYYRQYQFLFFVSILSVVIGLCQGILFYLILNAATLQDIYIPVVFLAVATGILYGLSLIFSEAGKRPWLKMAGVSMLILHVVLLITLIWSLSSQDGAVRTALEKIMHWALLTGSLIPVFLIKNFLTEIRDLKTENQDAPIRTSSESLSGLAGMIILFLTITFGVLLARESSQSLYWTKKNAEKTNEFAQRCDARTFTDSKGKTLSYLLMEPQDYDSQQTYPLVVALPYGGYEAPPALELGSDANRKKYPAFIFVPQCPPGEGWGGIPNYPTIDTLVFDAIVAMEKEFSIDPKRRYVTGVSRGGYGSWHFITTRPDMFAAAVPVCGGGDPSRAVNAVGVSVWAFHGALDKNVPVNGSRDMIAAITKAGGDPQYTEYENEAHNIWHRVSQTSGLWDWLFDQTRE